MRCWRARSAILRALADAVPEGESRVLRAHLATCAACRLEARRAGLLWRELAEMRVPDPGPVYREAFAGRVRRRLEEEDASDRAQSVRARQERWCWAALAATALWACALVALGMPQRRAARDEVAVLAQAVQAPGFARRILPATLDVEDPDLDLEDSLADLSRDEARHLLTRLQREIGSERSPRKEKSDAC